MTPLARISSSCAAFWHNASGNFGIMTALCVTPLIILACGSVDVVRMTSAKQRLQAMADSATLAAASLSNSSDMEVAIDEYMDANQPDEVPWDTLTYESSILTSSLNAKEVQVSASVTVKTPFLSLIGIDTSTVTADSTAVESASNIEISMVLDISSSMSGTKLTSLKSAASEFVEIMLDDEDEDYTSINLVPFGGTVNLGKSIYENYVNASSSAITYPSKSQYNVGTSVPYNNYLFPNAGYCIEYQDQDFDLDDIAANSRAQVPHFTRYSAKNDWCPPEESEVVLNTNDADSLTDHINAFELSDGTGMDIGVLWGAKALSPSLRGDLGGDFSDRPADFDDPETIKIAVIMSDGDITAQFRPKEPEDDADAMDAQNSSKRQTVVNKGNTSSSSSSSNNAIAYFKRICEDMDDNGIQIYTIGFKITSGSTADTLLEYCASSSGNYYFVEGLDLDDAFNSIAASINSLRISG